MGDKGLSFLKILHTHKPQGEGVLPYIGYTGMCRWKRYGFQAICSGTGSSNHRKLVCNRVSSVVLKFSTRCTKLH